MPAPEADPEAKEWRGKSQMGPEAGNMRLQKTVSLALKGC